MSESAIYSLVTVFYTVFTYWAMRRSEESSSQSAASTRRHVFRSNTV